MASRDRRAPRRFLPSRSARRGAVPADAAARAARRDPRLRRARRVRRALPAAVGAAGALGRQVPGAGERQPRARRLRIDAPRGSIVDRNGHVLVRNVLGTSLEVWPADLPKNREPRAAELRRARDGRRRSRGADRGADPRRRPDDPLTPVVIRRGIHDDQISYVEEHQLQFPGVQLADSYLRKYPHQSLAAHVLGHVGEISPEELKAVKKAGYQPQDVIGQAGVEPTYDRYLRGRDGSAQLTVDSRGRPTSPVTTQRRCRSPATRCGSRSTSASSGPPSRRSGTGSSSRTRTASPGRRRRRDRRDRPARRRRARDRLVPDLRAVGLRQPRPAQARAAPERGGRRREELSGPEPRDRRHLSARLDLEAGDGARGDAGAHPHAVLVAAVHAELSRSTSRPSTTGTRTSTSGWSCRRRSPSRATPTSTRSARRFYELPASRGHPLQHWASRFGFGADTGIDVGPEAAGLVPTPEWRGALRRPAVRRDRPHLEAGLLGPAGDRPGRPRRDAAPDDALLRDARERRPARDAAHRAGRRAADERPEAPAGAARARDAAADLERRRPGGALDRAARGSARRRTRADGTSYGVFGHFPISIAGKTGTAEKLSHAARLPERGEARPVLVVRLRPVPTSPTIVVCAVIENGGHGGTAAAPAALKVFEKYFKKHGDHDPAHLRRLMAIEAVDTTGPRPAQPPTDEAAGSSPSLGRLDWVLFGAAAGTRRFGALGDRRDHAPRPGRERRRPAGALRGRRARRARRRDR